MALDIKKIIAMGLLDLVATKELKSLTIAQIINHTGVSRQTFYNHFLDKDDLIHYIYDNIIIPDFNQGNLQQKFYYSLLLAFNNMEKHHKFMKEACLLEGQNCLKDYIFTHCQEFDLQWHQQLYGPTPMPEELVFATKYHATASSSMTLSWILANMPVSSEEIAMMIVKMRGLGMEELFAKAQNPGNPYSLD